MKKYLITLTTGDSFVIEAKDNDGLIKKLSTGKYGVLPLRSKVMILATPNNVAHIEELIEQEDRSN